MRARLCVVDKGCGAVNRSRCMDLGVLCGAGTLRSVG